MSELQDIYSSYSEQPARMPHKYKRSESLPPSRRNSRMSFALPFRGNNNNNNNDRFQDQERGQYDDDQDDRRQLRESWASDDTVARAKEAIAIKAAEGSDKPHDKDRPKLPLKQRMAHFTWAWYTLTMSTGGLSLLVFAQPFQFTGLRQIGFAIYIINLVMFVGVCSGMITRFVLFPGHLKQSLTHPREGFFVPTFFLTLATLITSSQRYVIPVDDPQLIWAIQTAFWGYVTVTLIVAVGQYSYVFAAHSFALTAMMPTWILPIFPIMLSGTIASVIAATQPQIGAVNIIVAGMTCQGLGLSVAFMMYAHMVGRLMQAGLPHREHRPGLFMCVGPPAFTALAFIGMANGLPANFDADGDGFMDLGTLKTAAMVSAVFLWALSFWWFGIAVVAIIQAPPLYFHLGWWACVFPNTGFTLATIALAGAFKNDALNWFATGMSILLFLVYFFVLFHHVRAVWIQDIMYPGRDEDVEDH